MGAAPRGGIWVDADNVYWIGQTVIESIPKLGGATVQLDIIPTYDGTSDGATLAWMGEVFKGGAFAVRTRQSTISCGNHYSLGEFVFDGLLHVDDRSVYMAEARPYAGMAEGGIYRLPLGGGVPIKVAGRFGPGPFDYPLALTGDATWIYVAEGTGIFAVKK